MNKIFLILALSICSYGAMSQEGIYSVLGAGQKECGEVVDVAEQAGFDSASYFFYVSFTMGVISTLNGTSEYIYGSKKNFAPKTKTLYRVIKKHCEENLTMKFHRASVDMWVKNAK